MWTRVSGGRVAPRCEPERGTLYELDLFIFCNRFRSWRNAVAKTVRRTGEARACATDDLSVRPEFLRLQPCAQAHGSWDGVRNFLGAGNGADGVGGDFVVQRAGDGAENRVTGADH